MNLCLSPCLKSPKISLLKEKFGYFNENESNLIHN